MRPDAPALVTVTEFEGSTAAVIRGCTDEESSARMRSWLDADPDRRQFTQALRRIIERQELPLPTVVSRRSQPSTGFLTERQRRIISERTTAALADKREREPSWRAGRPSGITDEIRDRIISERESKTLKAIAAGLNDDAIPTSQGGSQWWASTVKCVLDREAESANA